MIRRLAPIALFVALVFTLGHRLLACTGITLRAQDGAVVFGRTLEWGSFDLKSRLVIVPRGYEYKSHLEDDKTGFTWTSTYGTWESMRSRRTSLSMA